MKTVDLAKSTASDDHESVSDADVVVMISMIDYLITEIRRIDPMSAHHLESARESLADAVIPVAVARAH
jgi:hypothetical protein